MVEAIFDAYRADYRALCLVGLRSGLNDLTVSVDGRLRTLVDELRRALASELRLLLVEFSRAAGIGVDMSHLSEADRRVAEAELRRLRIQPPAGREVRNEPSRMLRILGSALRCAPQARWSNGDPFGLAVFLRYFENIAPQAHGVPPTEEQAIAMELICELGASLSLRQHGSLLLIEGQEEGVSERIRRTLHELRLPMPDRAEKQRFAAAALHLYSNASLEVDLSLEQVARLNERLPNRGLESLLRASHRTGRPVRACELIAQKSSDILSMSEGTLHVLETERLRGVKLHGQCVAHAQRLLQTFSAALRARNPAAPANLLLIGAPGTGKTELALSMAEAAGVPAFGMLSPKNSLVGETERRARLQQSILRESSGIGFIDEITEAMPTSRSSFDADGGATGSILASALTFLSDESRRGQVMVIATTNVPSRIGSALAERFTVVPVLLPLREDLPAITAAIAGRLDPAAARIDATHPLLLQAGALLHQKGASPRHIRMALGQAYLEAGALTPERILAAAADLRVVEKRAASLLAELWAIRACSLFSFLPWSVSPSTFAYPEHLESIVDPRTGEIDDKELERRIAELEPYADV